MHVDGTGPIGCDIGGHSSSTRSLFTYLCCIQVKYLEIDSRDFAHRFQTSLDERDTSKKRKRKRAKASEDADGDAVDDGDEPFVKAAATSEHQAKREHITNVRVTMEPGGLPELPAPPGPPEEDPIPPPPAPPPAEDDEKQLAGAASEQQQHGEEEEQEEQQQQLVSSQGKISSKRNKQPFGQVCLLDLNAFV